MPLNYLTCEKNGAIEMQHNNNNMARKSAEMESLPGTPMGLSKSSSLWGMGHRFRLNLSLRSRLLKSNRFTLPQASA